MLRISGSPLLIRFSEATSFDELSEPVSPLPKECFRFRDQTELVGLANTNTQLPLTRAAEFTVYKLKEMGKIDEKDISGGRV